MPDSTEELITRLRNFLVDFVPHKSGWVAPTPDDFNEFGYLVAAIRDAKWARDEDNDPTIEIVLADRSRGRRPWMPMLPYTDYDRPITKEEWRQLMACLDAAQSVIGQVRVAIGEHVPDE